MAIEKYFIPDFVELQRRSFQRFLETGLIEELNKRNPITNSQKDLEILLYPEYYKLAPPRWNSLDAILLSKTYSCRLYVPAQLTNRKTKQIMFKWVQLGDIPLMSKRGHFVVNGAARVIINQIVRGPGLYFSEIQYNVDSSKKTLVRRYAAEFISMRGTWLRLSIDKEKMIWAELKKTPKIPLVWFLLGMGLTEKILFQSLTQPKRLLYNYLDYLKIDNLAIDVKSQNDAFAKRALLRELLLKSKLNSSNIKTLKNSKDFKPLLLVNDIYSEMHSYKEKENRRYPLNSQNGDLADEKEKIPYYANSSLKALELIYSKITNTKKITNLNKKFFAKQGQKWIFKKFMNPRTYDLGLHGRLSLNKKLSLSLPLSQRTLTMYDVLVATEHLLRVEQGLLGTDDIDNLKNRRVRTSSDLIQMQIGIGLLRLEKNIRSKFTTIKGVPKINYFFSTKPLNGALKEFFGTNPLSQFMDMINPLAEMTHKRRLTTLGPGGVSRDTATMDIRGIHPTHYGRICPVETPEGKNAGLVNALTTFARVNPEGLIETPFYKVYKGQVQKKAGFFYLSAEKEEKAIIAAGDLNLSKTGFLPKGLIPVRKFDEFTKVLRNYVDFMSVSPLQMISVATSLVPFLEHDDANRALMGANMQRQAVPLVRSEQAIVGTGIETRIASDSGHVIRAKAGGLVGYVSGQKIRIYTFVSNF
uniref:DNA-directed RNA polymerase subunit beta N-terminal section n=1 Tax=Stigeoclonium helveticum TaxID=55999 RepID=RPOB1_STIHE|nr:beta subunit of RNA polymerase [Stigeoclonium helveticum]Q06SE7.1 RecName: Full=DNA-directed RNA polymerase subunit beta N-terminal section; AltName: Full=PEP; AltName: Full=Plastid-encoded RNA polymerase subunit beta N-terminal section; Short=RNA polymerase subunit beta N-terminal section [Stigeoclonium helveticum]ABF60214.1 beta subunit of RNA polymerase [Stigeoclonium helveticum]